MKARFGANDKRVLCAAIRAPLRGLLYLAAAGAVSCVAFAESAEAKISGSLSVSTQQDDNVYRAPVGSTPGQGQCRSDLDGVARGQLGVNFGDTDRPYGSVPPGWAGDLSGVATQAIYRCNSALDNTGEELDFDLASPAISLFDFTTNGTLSHRRSAFEETGSTAINAQTLLRLGGRGEFRITPDAALLFDPSFNFSHNSNITFKPQDYSQYGMDIGVGYFSPLGNSVAIIAKQSYLKGRYPNLLSDGPVTINLRNDIRERSAQLQLTYDPSVFTTLQVNVGYAWSADNRDLPPPYERLRSNYNGLIGNARLDYHPSDWLHIQLGATRQLVSQNYLLASGTKTDIYDVKVDKKIGKNITITTHVSYINQGLNYQSLSNLSKISSNRLMDFDLGMSWEMWPGLSLALDASHQKRLSGGVLASFDENAFELQIAYAFGGKAE